MPISLKLLALMTYEGAINNALDKEVRAELDDTLAHKSEDELTDDERKYLKRKREKKCQGHDNSPDKRNYRGYLWF